MSEYAPGSFQFAERIMDMNVEERRRGTESRRILGRSRTGRRAGHRFYFSALAKLGNRLSAWGERLEERYGTDGSAPVPQSAKV